MPEALASMANRFHQSAHEAGSLDHCIDDQVFMVGVRASANGAQPVEGRHTQGGGEVTVAATADRLTLDARLQPLR